MESFYLKKQKTENTGVIFRPCKQIQSILSIQALFLTYEVCRGLLYLCGFYPVRDPHDPVSSLICLKEYISLPAESISILPNNTFSSTSKEETE